MKNLNSVYYDKMWELAKFQFVLDYDSIHGFDHWESVYDYGTLLGDFCGADLDVIKHFAIFHDCQRLDDNRDPNHGKRACQYILSIRNQINLNDGQFQELYRAILSHSDGLVTENKTIGCCWDADRLELTRCKIIPSQELMSTQLGKDISIFIQADPLISKRDIRNKIAANVIRKKQSVYEKDQIVITPHGEARITVVDLSGQCVRVSHLESKTPITDYKFSDLKIKAV